MTRTTPPRPLDVTAHFPELAPLARTAVRLHPRAGAPTAAESSVGGPLLWPADEEWPSCPEHAGPWHRGVAPEDVHVGRRVLRAAWARTRPEDADLLSEEERALVDLGTKSRRIAQDGPVPMVPVAQIRAADVPTLPRPEGTDLLQVLWCPFDHPEDGYVPRVELRWRRAADVVTQLGAPPRPAVIGSDHYLPEPCVLHPETVTEYPAPHELPEELADRIEEWEQESEDEDEPGLCYQYDLAVAPGWKLGGHAPWSFSDPFPMACAECGAGMRPLLTVDGTEWDGGSGSWRPVEDAGYTGYHFLGPALDTQINIGRSYSLQVYVCERSYDHPLLQNMQ
ncbi:hypothetical protein GCM10010260_16400 [Streptomyces filipinensis]|uniref:DUF1963 domain-containing protein n=1 Tax=Streptomyces filipinensis TaxID=66887 RepID=A0A918I991_9ACTN|nr:hypothetical protein [Streptomyces filipinensis]GGU84204.1 hypothetical protein GCM10010260_16400 [Streptomyces filipinensis]